MSRCGVSFVGFGPADRQKDMKTLNEVIRLKSENKEKAEEAQGWDISEQEKYTRRFKPVIDNIQASLGAIISYNSDKDITKVSKEYTESLDLLNDALQQAEADPSDGGLIALVSAYTSQALYAKAKGDFLKASKNLNLAKTEAKKFDALSKYETARDNLVEALENFESVQIPIGFDQVVDIERPPPKGEVFPGASLQVPASIEQTDAGLPPSHPKNLPTTLGTVPAIGPIRSAPKLVVKPTPTELQQPQELSPAEGDEPQAGSVPLKPRNWRADLLKLDSTMQPPSNVNIKPTPGQISLTALPEPESVGNERVVSFLLMDPTGIETAALQMYKSNEGFGKYRTEWTDFKGKRGRFMLPAIDFYKLLTGDIGGLTFLELSNVITTMAEIFGGWGEGYWSKNGGVDEEAKAYKNNENYERVVDMLSANNDTIGLGMVKEDPPQPKKPAGRKSTARPVLKMDGQYGGAIIDTLKLLNEGRLVVHKDGKKMLDEIASKDLKQLLTKRVLKSTMDKASAEAKKQLDRVNRLAGVSIGKVKPPAPVKGGKKMMRPAKKVPAGDNIIVVGDVKDMLERLKVATGVYNAGNRSKKNVQLITDLASKLREEGAIKTSEMKNILSKYRPS